MSILGNILGRIFGRAEAAPAQTATPDAPAQTPLVGITPPLPQAMSAVDVQKVMEGKAAQGGQALNWKTSIVDLMKLLDIDSSLDSRKALARELDFTGDMNDSVAMNIWLHKQVMNKVAENGGELPAGLRD